MTQQMSSKTLITVFCSGLFFLGNVSVISVLASTVDKIPSRPPGYRTWWYFKRLDYVPSPSSTEQAAQLKIERKGATLQLVDGAGQLEPLPSVTLVEAKRALGKPQKVQDYYRFKVKEETSNFQWVEVSIDLRFKQNKCSEYRVTVPPDFPPPGVVSEWLPSTELAKPVKMQP